MSNVEPRREERGLPQIRTPMDANEASSCSCEARKVLQPVAGEDGVGSGDDFPVGITGSTHTAVCDKEEGSLDVVSNGRIDSDDSERPRRYVAAVGKQGKDQSREHRGSRLKERPGCG
ncbi:hypothetical protein B296_00009617 [Ensete ventricosum]|uniref:Uncharacterized protein n=1 Tax=Ensete ventricosum TaxID=4639 RepID=A0A426YCD0_ENSVE|nr:hypothetical protein B296_00009617 [Ensete ventricosum]